MKRRLITVVLALVLAAIGTVGVLMYVSRADARAVAGQKAVTVLIAELPIPAGTSAAAAMAGGQLVSRTLPAASVTADAVGSITPELGGLVTGADLAAGQLLLRPMLVPMEDSTNELGIPEGKVAVSLQFCAQAGVAGYVRVGSLITITDTVSTEGLEADVACDGPHKFAPGVRASTTVALPSVEVLAVGAAPNRAPVEDTTVSAAAADTTEVDAEAQAKADAKANPVSKDGLMLTVAVTLADAQRLIALSHVGLPYLVLLPGSAP